MKDTREQTQKMISEAKDKAKAEYDRIVAEAQQAISQQKNAALTEVKNQVGALVIEVSEKVLRRELSDKSQQEKYINQLAEDLKLS
jgi:F-type H+-transporting ATPase subunit b